MEVKKQELKKLYSEAGVPVIEAGYKTMKNNNGLWIRNYSGEGETIFVYNGLSNKQKAVIILHEIGHSKCSKKQCSCMTCKDYSRSEEHAILYSLEELMKRRLFGSVIFNMDSMIYQVKHNPHYCFSIASKRIMRRKLWRGICQFIKDKQEKLSKSDKKIFRKIETFQIRSK